MKLNPIVLKAIAMIIVALCWSTSVWGAGPYKVYTVHSHGNQDVLCDSYTVQKNEHVWQILRRKGRIAERDFPKFAAILKDLNPHIKDIDRIYPGQQILVPLKQMGVSKQASDGSTRYVTIPMIPDVLYKTQHVRQDDSVSKIVMAHLGLPWRQIPKDYFRTFKQLNPDITNLALVYPGQTIRVPDLTAKEPSKTEPGDADARKRLQARLTPEKPPIPPSVETQRSRRDVALLNKIMSESVSQLGGQVLASGQCYFPQKGKDDLRLDLAAFPVIELEDGRHLLLETGQGLPEHMEVGISAFWKDLMIIPIDPKATNEGVVDRVFHSVLGKKVQKVLDLPALDDGVRVTVRGDWIYPVDTREGSESAYKCITLIEDPDEYTSPSVVEYLVKENIQVVDIMPGESNKEEAQVSEEAVFKECPVLTIDGSGQEAFVSGFVKALGYSYKPRVPISFDYAGFEVKTTANLVCGEKDFNVVVDFGTFYGETKSALEATGVKVLSIGPDEKPLTIASGFLTLAGIAYSEAPVFYAANRKLSKTTSVTIPGILVSQANEKRLLLTRVHVHVKLGDFLMEKQIRVLKIDERI